MEEDFETKDICIVKRILQKIYNIIESMVFNSLITINECIEILSCKIWFKLIVIVMCVVSFIIVYVGVNDVITHTPQFIDSLICKHIKSI